MSGIDHRLATVALELALARIPSDHPNAQHARQCVLAAILALRTRQHPSGDDLDLYLAATTGGKPGAGA